jgi:hypothetical protein
VWQAALGIARDVVAVAESRRWRGYLRDQAERAAWPVAANIAGRIAPLARATDGLRPWIMLPLSTVPGGSLYELDTWLIAAQRMKLLDDGERASLEVRIKDLSVRLHKLATSLRSRSQLDSRR